MIIVRVYFYSEHFSIKINSNDDKTSPQNLTRDNTQLLFNSLFSLPSSVVEKVKCVQLPAPTTKLPREKPIPKPKTLTKWEAFAKSKGSFLKISSFNFHFNIMSFSQRSELAQFFRLPAN